MSVYSLTPSLYATGTCLDNRKKWDACLGPDYGHDHALLQPSAARTDAAPRDQLDDSDHEAMMTDLIAPQSTND